MSSSSDPRAYILGIMGFFGGLYYFVKGLSWLKQKRLIENTPTSKIRSIAMGLVEVCGEVVLAQGKLLKSPFSVKDCVYCKYAIEEYRRSGKSSHWVIVKSDEQMTQFYLKDETGMVLVDPEGAKLEIPMDFEFNSGWGKDPPESVKQFLNNNKMNFEGFLGFNKTMRYREYIIEPQNKLYVMGTAGDNPFVDEGEGANNATDIMIQKGVDGNIYYISDRPEKDVCKNLQQNIILGVYGGGALAVVCFAIILYYLKII